MLMKAIKFYYSFLEIYTIINYELHKEINNKYLKIK